LIPIATFLDSRCKESVTASVKLMEGTDTRIIEQQQLCDAWPGRGSFSMLTILGYLRLKGYPEPFDRLQSVWFGACVIPAASMIGYPLRRMPPPVKEMTKEQACGARPVIHFIRGAGVVW
jgi:hypothetical protein